MKLLREMIHQHKSHGQPGVAMWLEGLTPQERTQLFREWQNIWEMIVQIVQAFNVWMGEVLTMAEHLRRWNDEA